MASGADHEVAACPCCDRTGKVERRVGGMHGSQPRSDAAYYCGACGADFEEPTYRQAHQQSPSEPIGGEALREADPDELLPDGGRVTTAERSPLQSCEFYAPVGLLAQVETLVELDLYHSRSEAVRSALRREVRLQAEAPDEVGQQLQRIYDAAMQGRRPETIGGLERLAELLGYDLDRETHR